MLSEASQAGYRHVGGKFQSLPCELLPILEKYNLKYVPMVSSNLRKILLKKKKN